ncbi:MAG: DUF4440 domain-containing protein [Actinomycetales bacterium]|nr:DUF4440 domain-containing protein [Actinomycetales bacterium]
MADRSAHHEEILSAEIELLTTACRSDRRRLESLLHGDFREHGASGRVWTRDETIDTVTQAPGVAGDAGDFRSTDLADGVVLLTYRIRGEHGSTRSSIWVREDGRWLLRFHQGTRTPS